MGNPRGRPRPHDWRTGNHGYRVLFDPKHPIADRFGYVLQHVLVASAALGKRLPEGAQVHHVNGNKTDNRSENLVICQDRAYHSLLHQRQAALRQTGHADWRRCAYCWTYDDPANLVYHGKRAVVHRACRRSQQKKQYHLKRGHTQ